MTAVNGGALTGRPVHRAPAEKVEMDVKDRLSRVPVRVEYRAVASGGDPALLRNRGGAPHDLSDERIIVRRQLVQRSDMAPWNDQNVRGRLRIDVVERDDVLVFVHDRRIDLAVDDSAEETLWHFQSVCA